MPSWWPFGKGGKGDGGEAAPEMQQAEVEKIADCRFVRDFRDGENRVIGLEYLLRWKDGAPDSWCGPSLCSLPPSLSLSLSLFLSLSVRATLHTR
jgi:hypothetical protein